MMTRFEIGFCLIVFSIFFAWYYPYYLERASQHDKHLFVLLEECREGKLHPKIQHDEMRYEGLQTNCSRATVFTSTPVWAGALVNLWQGSIFYTLIYADNWKIQATYTIAFIIVAVATVHYSFKYNIVSKVLEKSSRGNNRIVLNGRQFIKKPQVFSEKEPVGPSKNHINHLIDTTILSHSNQT